MSNEWDGQLHDHDHNAGTALGASLEAFGTCMHTWSNSFLVSRTVKASLT